MYHMFNFYVPYLKAEPLLNINKYVIISGNQVVAPWLNWIEQPPPKGQVTGSNPVGVTILQKFNLNKQLCII